MKLYPYLVVRWTPTMWAAFPRGVYWSIGKGVSDALGDGHLDLKNWLVIPVHG